jgi:hypothetical protein
MPLGRTNAGPPRDDGYVPEETALSLLSPVSFWFPERIVEPGYWVSHIPFAFWLVETHRPGVLVELGTQSGNSYLSLCQAVQQLRLDTRCTAVDTWKGDAYTGPYGESVYTSLKTYHDERYAPFSRLMRSTFDNALDHFHDGTIDLLHIDGMHIYESVRHDFLAWSRKLSARGLVLFHDTNVRERHYGVFRLWRELRGLHPHFEFLHGYGLGVLGVGREQNDKIKQLFFATRQPSSQARIREQYARLGAHLSDHLELRRMKTAEADASDTTQQMRQPMADVHESPNSWSADADRIEKDAMEQERPLCGIHAKLAPLRTEQDVRGHRLTERSTQLEHLRADVATQERSLARQSAEIKHLRAEIGERDARLASMSTHEAHLRYELTSIRRTTLWKLGIPLRSFIYRHPALERLLRRILTGLRRRGKTPGALTSRADAFSVSPSRPCEHKSRNTISRIAKRFCWCFPSHWMRRYREYRLRRLISDSGLFDSRWYLEQNPDVEQDGLSPLHHYVRWGWQEGRPPHRLFDSGWYLRHNPDVEAARIDPLFHYLRWGAREGRNPHPLFDMAWYLERNPDVATSGLNPLTHYLRYGTEEGRDPHPLFVTSYFLEHKASLENHRT